jgi:toxin ParE1/3/4
MVPEYGAPDIREVIERPYRIIYRIREDQIEVLAVVHSAQVLPPQP